MKKEDFVSTLVMTAVSILMLVGVTIAWYTAVYANPTVTGMQMYAEEQGDIKIALTPGGDDIAVLRENDIENDEYVKIGLEEEEFVNIENGQMAPGAYGSVVFYITPLKEDITSCQIVPSLIPVYEEGVVVDEETKVTINNIEKNVLTVLEEHFDFYSDEGMTVEVNEEKSMHVDLEWEGNAGKEKKVTLYWKWHYEDPAAAGMKPGAEKEAVIYDYDMEDTWIGTHLDTMSFHFDFLIQ